LKSIKCLNLFEIDDLAIETLKCPFTNRLLYLCSYLFFNYLYQLSPSIIIH